MSESNNESGFNFSPTDVEKTNEIDVKKSVSVWIYVGIVGIVVVIAVLGLAGYAIYDTMVKNVLSPDVLITKPEDSGREMLDVDSGEQNDLQYIYNQPKDVNQETDIEIGEDASAEYPSQNVITKQLWDEYQLIEAGLNDYVVKYGYYPYNELIADLWSEERGVMERAPDLPTECGTLLEPGKYCGIIYQWQGAQRYTMDIDYVDQEEYDLLLVESGAKVYSSQQCIEAGGRPHALLGNERCQPGEAELGYVNDLISGADLCCQPKSDDRISMEEAEIIANSTPECTEKGLYSHSNYNPYSGTYWFYYSEDIDGCGAACVVNELTSEAYVNSMCTGAL